MFKRSALFTSSSNCQRGKTKVKTITVCSSQTVRRCYLSAWTSKCRLFYDLVWKESEQHKEDQCSDAAEI